MNLSKQEVKRKFFSALDYVKTFFKWLLFAGLTGAICGIVGSAFDMSVDMVTDIFKSYNWFIYLLPIGGLLIVLLYRISKVEMKIGTNNVINSIRTKEKVPVLLVPLIFISTVITHLFGGSAGREGAALQIGGGIGNQLGRVFKLSEKDLHLITMCGMSGLFAALFGTPLTATIFAIEVISIGIVHYSALVPCLTSSLTAYGIAKLIGVQGVNFTVINIPDFSAVASLKSAAIGIICAVVSIIFCIAMHGTQELFKKHLKNEYVRIFAGSCMIILLTLIFPSHDYNGTGMGIIEKAVESGEAVPYAFAVKILFTAITIGCGLKGGEMVPTFFIGATLGCTAGSLIGLDPAFSAALGFIGMFCAVMNCPIAGIIMSVEVFGARGIVYFAIVCAVSYLLSGYYGLYSSQKIMYSKLTAEFVNKDTKIL